MQTTNPSNLFQSDASLRAADLRASKAARTTGPDSQPDRYGDPIVLAGATSLARPSVNFPSSDDSVEDAKSANVESALEGAAAPAKVLSMRVVDGEAWTAESSGQIRRVDLESGKTLQVLKGHTGPVAALAFWEVGGWEGKRTVLFSGSWDKSIKVWEVEPASSNITSRPRPLLTLPSAHSDFVKALLILPSMPVGSSSPAQSQNSLPLLVSGGSDKLVRFWDLRYLSSLFRDGASSLSSLQEAQVPVAGVFREHTRPVDVLAAPPSGAFLGQPPLIYTADSMGRIYEVKLEVAGSAGEKDELRVRGTVGRELKGHATAVYDLSVGWVLDEDEDEDEENGPVEWGVELWSVSADKTAQCFLLQSPSSSNSASVLPSGQLSSTPKHTLPHPYYVRSILVFSHLRRSSLEPSLPNYVLTGSTDEHIRVWDLSPSSRVEDLLDESTPASKPAQGGIHLRQAKLVREVEGHWDEIGALGAWWRSVEGSGGKKRRELWVVSAGLDGTIRRWRLSDISQPTARLHASSSTHTSVLAAATALSKSELDSSIATAGPDSVPPTSTSRTGLNSSSTLTAEEEAELAELLSDED